MGSPQSYNPTGAMEIVPFNENGQVINIDVTASAVQILTTPKVGRVSVIFQNVGTITVFLEHTSAVTASGATRGWVLAVGRDISLDAGDDVTFFIIAGGVETDIVQAWEV